VCVETEEKGEAYQLLTTTGFTPDVADILSRSYPEERIRRQCQWLPRRNAQRNRLGLLRRAIEEDWPEPQGAPTLPKSIAAALRAHGDEFYQSFIERRRREQRQAIQAARKAHEERFAEAYQEYLQRQEKELRELYPEVYDRFVEGEARERARLAGAMPASSRFREVALRTFDQESDHLERLSAFLRGQSGESIADFWSWDTALNPERFDPHRA
jgi:hypothetical protein